MSLLDKGFHPEQPLQIQLSGSGSFTRSPDLGILELRIESQGPSQNRMVEEVRSAIAGIQRSIEKGSTTTTSSSSSSSSITTATADSTTTLRPSGSKNPGRENVDDKEDGTALPPSSTTTSSPPIPTKLTVTPLGVRTWGGQKTSRVFQVEAKVVAAFRDAAALNAITAGLVGVPLVTITKVSWTLRDETARAARHQAVLTASASALDRARAWAAGMGLTKVRPVRLVDNSEGDNDVAGIVRVAAGPSGMGGRYHRGDSSSYYGSGPAKITGGSGGSGSSGGGGILSGSFSGGMSKGSTYDTTYEEHVLAYMPLDITVKASCDCKFEIS